MNVENQITLDQFKPRFYQSIILDAWENKGYRKILYVLGRRSGKDYLAWNMAIRQCLKKTCLVLYCLPTYNQCRKVIFDAIAIDGTRFLDLIPSDLVANINATEQKITFNNGSILRLIGADSYNTSLVGTNAQMIILSEASLMQLESVYAYARPILAANGGTILVFGCVAPNTLVIGSNGLRRIKDVSPSREEYSPYGKKIYGLGGFHVAEDFYYGGIQKTRKITLSSGYQLEATCIHPVWNGTAWVKTEDLKIGDLIPIQYGQNVWGKGLDYTEIATRAYGRNGFTKPYREDDFFYLLGLIHADGCYDKYKVTVTKKKDQSIIDFLEHQGFRTGKDGIHHNLNSVNFCSFLEGLDFKHGAKNKTFPEKFFDCSRKQMRAFLQGLFDGDGTSNKCPSHYGSIKLTSTCLEFIRDLQIILLNFGIVSSIRREEKGPSVKVKVSSTIYNLEITGYFAHIFYETIGFRLRRKQANHEFISEGTKEESGNVYPVDVEKLFGYRFGKNRINNKARFTRRLIAKLNKENSHPYLQELLSEKFYYSPIVSIEESESEVFDFVIPVTHSFFSNGFISHNTPRGKNAFWQMWKTVQMFPDWFVLRMGASETHHMSDEVLSQERLTMSDELYAQEYEVSFDKGVEGQIYGRELQKAHLEGRIGYFPHQPQLQTHLAIDIGVRDETTLLWFQVTHEGNGTIFIIDAYSNTNMGIDHYAQVIQQKSYRMGKYFAPHDLAVREWGGGAITRYEKAAQLGIDFEILEQIDVIDGIDNVKAMFPRIHINIEKCKRFVDCLENYHREWDETKQIHKPKPVHNYASNYADSLRYLCMALPKTQRGMTPEEFDRKHAEALYGAQNGLPKWMGFDPRYDRR